MSDERESFFRVFDLTIRVWVPKDGPLPETFRDWLERATGVPLPDGPATPTTLVHAVELREPLADDVIDRRGRPGTVWS